ncbi:MAG: VTT domain-containing protein, partial [Thermodesulfobacteriota bacterium]
WDTPHHSPDDPRRVDPAGNPYAPFHDVQMAVDGAAAAALGELVRERWRRGTEKPIIPAAQAEYDPWPAELPVDMEHVDVGIARTIPAFQGNSEVKEVETVYRDAISAAHRFIYIENQYFTSAVIGELLESRLGEKDGPEIVMVLPKRSSGWLERSTMDVRRSRLLQRLRTADRFGHLRIYYPVVPGLGEEQINVHSKVLVVDNHLVKIGSSNISNRSMGLDTECDLAIEAAESRTEKAIAAFRSRLLGEHLGVDPEHVSETLSSEGSLISSVEKLRGGGRSLLPVSSADPEWTDNLIADIGIADPEKPLDPETFIEEFIPEEIRSPKSRRLFWIAGILVFMVFLSAAWRWTPLNKWIDLQNLGAVADTLRGSTAAPFIMLAIYPIGSLILIPVTLMIVSTAFIFGPLAGLIYSLLGSMFAAAFTYGIGRFLGRDTVRRLGGSRINRLSKRLSRHGVITTAVVRMLPIAPFTVVSMAAGASHIHFRDFIFGTLLGMSPGIIAITIFEHRLEVAIQEPGTESFAILAILLVLIIIAAVLFRRWLSPTEYVDNPQEKE